MTRDVNPFEAWRPPASGPPEKPASPLSLRPSQSLTLIGLLGLGAFGLHLVNRLPGSHLPRIVGALLPLGVGLGVALTVARRRKWSARLAWFGAGLGVAILAWWFVPTTNGRNLWSARQESFRLVADLEALAPGEAPGYEAGKEARRALVVDFPELRPPAEEAEHAWVERSTTRWESELAQLAPRDYAGLEALRSSYRPFLNERLQAAQSSWFGRTYSSLTPGDFAAVRRARANSRGAKLREKRIHGWESGWADRTVTAAVKEVEPVLGQNPDGASRRYQEVARGLADLGDYPSAQEQLRAARRQAALARLELARQEMRALVAADRFQAAAGATEKLATDWESEARAVGLMGDFTRLQEGYAFLADLARRAGKPDPK